MYIPYSFTSRRGCILQRKNIPKMAILGAEEWEIVDFMWRRITTSKMRGPLGFLVARTPTYFQHRACEELIHPLLGTCGEKWQWRWLWAAGIVWLCWTIGTGCQWVEGAGLENEKVVAASSSKWMLNVAWVAVIFDVVERPLLVPAVAGRARDGR